MEHLISIQAAADQVGISTRWIWKQIRVDRTLHPIVRNGRVYLSLLEWEAFMNNNARAVEAWHRLHIYLKARYLGR